MTRYRGLPVIAAVTLLLTGLLAAPPAVSAPPGDRPGGTVARLAQNQGIYSWEVGVAVTAGSCAGRATYVLSKRL